jgi:hypothetical protein
VAAQPAVVAHSLVFSRPVGFEIPLGGAVLAFPACTAAADADPGCVVRLTTKATASSAN